MKTRNLILAAALLAAPAALAENEEDRRPPPHPPGPVIETLDADHDHKLSAKEIERAPAALKELDKNGDGELTQEELRPKPREEQEESKGPKNRSHRPPPVIAALDENRDGKISEEELESAARSLAKLDKNGDGELTPQELQPPHKRPDEGRKPRREKE